MLLCNEDPPNCGMIVMVTLKGMNQQDETRRGGLGTPGIKEQIEEEEFGIRQASREQQNEYRTELVARNNYFTIFLRTGRRKRTAGKFASSRSFLFISLISH